MRLWFSAGAFLGGLAVMMAAFGAHALHGRLTPRMMGAYQVAARYHMYCALALMGVGLARPHLRGPWVDRAGGLLLAGAVLFCGSLYAMALSGMAALGWITPVGGVCMIAGWFALGWAALRHGPAQ